MHIDQIKTFLDVVSTGNFHKTAENLNVSQSSVSARIRSLEEELGRKLFTRGHAGAVLTPSGERLLRHATSLSRLWQRARQDVALSDQYRDSISLGVAISLWDQLEIQWVSWMRNRAPDVAVHVEADFSPGLMAHLRDGVLDIGLMYEPQKAPGLTIEEFMSDQLYLLTSHGACRVDDPQWRKGYVKINWGEPFKQDHDAVFPKLTPELTVGLGMIAVRHILEFGGSAYFPVRMVMDHIRSGLLEPVKGAPVFERMGCLVYSSSPANKDLLLLGLQGLRDVTKVFEAEASRLIAAWD